MMKKALLPLAALLLLAACKGGQKENDAANEFFPAHSFLLSQIKHIDTSLYPLRKIVRQNGRSDTSYLHRNQFRQEAADFIALPDIASKQWKDDYTESKLYDDMLQRAVITYTPKEESAPVLREDITIEPGPGGGEAAVRTIFINQIQEKKDSTVQKKMLWEVGKRFQVVTTVLHNGAPEQTRTVEVWWAPLASAE